MIKALILNAQSCNDHVILPVLHITSYSITITIFLLIKNSIPTMTITTSPCLATMPYLDQKKNIYKYFTKFDLMVYGSHYNGG